MLETTGIDEKARCDAANAQSYVRYERSTYRKARGNAEKGTNKNVKGTEKSKRTAPV